MLNHNLSPRQILYTNLDLAIGLGFVGIVSQIIDVPNNLDGSHAVSGRGSSPLLAYRTKEIRNTRRMTWELLKET
ncbi:MAG: hypothetical protein ABFS03_08420 [Chloroflexota bacterium]